MKRINYWVAAGISKNLTTKEILEEVMFDLDIKITDLGLGSNKREFVDRRTVICYLMHRIVGATSTEVGLLLKCDHCTVLHHCKKCLNFMETDQRWGYIKRLESKYRLIKIKRI